MALGTSGIKEVPANDVDILCAADPVSDARAPRTDQRALSNESDITLRELIDFHESRLRAARRRLHAKGCNVPFELRERVRKHERFLDYLRGGE